MGDKSRLAVPDYIERGLHTSKVTGAVTEEFVEVAGADLLPPCHPKLAVALTALACFPPLRILFSWFGPNRDVFAIIMKGPSYLVYNAPRFLFGRGKRSAWITDTWPNRDKRLILLAKVLRLKPIFVSYRQSAERLRKIAPHLDWVYVPEALPRDQYPSKPAAEREWDVITFGRKYMEHHEALKAGNADGQIKYLFRDDGVHVASTHEELLSALGNSRIAICVPRGVTHEHAGGVEAMTMRYLQSMACGCLVLGETPGEMRDLFGYDPVVKANIEDAAGQIREILANWDEYQKLIDRNFETLMRDHQWRERAAFITGELKSKYGFRLSSVETPVLSHPGYDGR